MSRVKWRARALADIERLYSFLNVKDAIAASQAAFTISQAAQLLETSPRIGRPMLDDTGRRGLFVPYGAGAYVLRYLIDSEGTLVVIGVWHSKEQRA